MKEEHIKTFRFIKWTKRLALIYFFICIFSLIAVYSSSLPIFEDNIIYFRRVASTILLWGINPMVFIVSLVGMIQYFIERKNAEKRKIIGKRWLWFIFCDIATFWAWFISLLFWVGFTGGV